MWVKLVNDSTKARMTTTKIKHKLYWALTNPLLGYERDDDKTLINTSLFPYNFFGIAIIIRLLKYL